MTTPRPRRRPIPDDTRLIAAIAAAGLQRMPEPEDVGLRAGPGGVWTSRALGVATTKAAPPQPLPPAWPPGPNAKLLPALTSGDCRFPVGEAGGVDQLFCAEQRLSKRTAYCPMCLLRIQGRTTRTVH